MENRSAARRPGHQPLAVHPLLRPGLLSVIGATSSEGPARMLPRPSHIRARGPHAVS